MGANNTKKANLKEIGNKANKESPNSFVEPTMINLTNNIIIGKSKSDPSKDYKKKSFLGIGSIGSVYKVQHFVTESIRAMKVIKKPSNFTEEKENEIFNELSMLEMMDHPNILKIFEFYSNKESYSIIMEYCSSGELFEEIYEFAPFTEEYAAYIMYQIFSAVNYCHNMNIVHGDLSPDNILIVDKDRKGLPKIKICDFGTSKLLENDKKEDDLISSPYYIAPEAINKNYDKKCDIWSCGVIMYLLLSGKPPFGGDDDKEILENIQKGEYDFNGAPLNLLSQSAIDLIRKLLVVDKDKRITAQEALNHPWFKEQKSNELYNEIKDETIIIKLLNNLKIYRRISIIQETALAYLIHNFPQLKDIVNACKLFNLIDTNGNGKITEKELLKGISKNLKKKSNTLEEDVHNIFRNLDMDNSGYIQYEEFVRAAVNKEKFLNDNILRFAFKYFDKDGSGEITLDEIEEVFKKNVSDSKDVSESLKRIIKEVDTNGDGIISFEEFSNAMKKMLK